MPNEEILKREGPSVGPNIPPEVEASGVTEVPNHEEHLRSITKLLDNGGAPIARHTGETLTPETDHAKASGIIRPIQPATTEPKDRSSPSWWRFQLKRKHALQGKEEKNAA